MVDRSFVISFSGSEPPAWAPGLLRWAGVPVLMTVLMVAGPAMAYSGPGAGIGAIGSVLALVGTLLFATLGFIWYPLRRLLRWVGGRARRTPD